MASRAARSAKPRRGDARAALLDAAHGLVRRQGWAATSVDQLCAAAGVTKGAFFHHFASKDALGAAAAQHWCDMTGPVFTGAPYNDLADPLARIFGYLDFRVALADGPLADISCFAGTMVQENFATSEAIRAGCNAAIVTHAARLEADFAAAIALYPPRAPVDPASLALFTQTVLQGGFITAKAAASTAPLLAAIGHLRSYLTLLFDTEPLP